MRRAIALAQRAGERGEIPVGALIINAQGKCLTEAENQRERLQDPTAHAEIVALRQTAQKAAKLAFKRLYPVRHPRTLSHVRWSNSSVQNSYTRLWSR